jgi:hypothetical protein
MKSAFIRNLRLAVLGIGFIVASFALYLGVGLSFLVYRADGLLTLSCFMLAAALDLALGWALHLHTRKSIRTTIFLSSGGILAGTFITSIAIWRSHWLELVEEFFRSITMQ